MAPMSSPKNWLECPECGFNWEVHEGRFCPICESKGVAEPDNG